MQSYISKSLEGLDYNSKYLLEPYQYNSAPLFIFGMYRREDLDVLIKHKGQVTVIWQGSDAKDLESGWVHYMAKARHIASSHWIKQTLDKWEIPNTLKYISATRADAQKNEPNGDSIYFYTSDSAGHIYGEEMLEPIKERTGLNIIRATSTTYSKEELREVYKQCFLNLRLTKYDGCPNTNLEMGLMGRKSIYNGDFPHSIKWKNLDDICENILKEYSKRHENNNYISEDFIKFINENTLQ